MLALLATLPAFVPCVLRNGAPTRSSSAVMVAAKGDRAALSAATKVISAARKFGPTQAKSSKQWVDQALAGENTEQLMELQLALFEECSLDDDSGACKELEAALQELTDLAVSRRAQGLEGSTAIKGYVNPFTAQADPMKKAQMRVLQAAATFGPEQKQSAEEWMQQTAVEMEADGGASLLGKQIDLFGECLLSEDGTPSKCEELSAALAAFQTLIAPVENVDVATATTLQGKVASTSAAAATAKD